MNDRNKGLQDDDNKGNIIKDKRVKYYKPVWKIIKDATSTLEEPFSVRDILVTIQKVHPEIKESTIRSTIVGCCINHTSAHYYAIPERFLFYVSRGKYKMYKPETDGKWIVDKKGSRREDQGAEKDINLSKYPAVFEKIDEDLKIAIPVSIRKGLKLDTGDYIGFIQKDSGEVVVKKARMRFEIE